MSRRRPRVELSAIATLDADVTRAQQECEDQVRLAAEKLTQRKNGPNTGFHDRYLENLRHFFESEVLVQHITASQWPHSVLQAFLQCIFTVYRDSAAFDGVCDALRAEGASCGLENGEPWIQMESFDVLKRALQRDTATRIPIYDTHAQPASIETENGPASSPGRPSPRRKSSHLAQTTASETSSAAISSSSVVDDLQKDAKYTVPANSVVVATELRVEVLKKSQNWLGRWRSRQLSLRWNELEMTNGRRANGTGNGAAGHNRHSIARSFPSQPAVLMAAGTAGHDLSVISSDSGSTKTKRYALQNLLSLQLIQLNESEPSRKLALDLHFKQAAANGHGFTTKSLIVTSEKPSVKDLMAKIATLTLFRGLVAGDLKPPMFQKLVQAGANVNAFCVIPVPTRVQLPATTLCPLQLVFLQYCQASDATRDGALATVKMLLEAKADPRSLLHWHFARRVLLSREPSQSRAFESLTSMLDNSWTTAFGSDAHGWTLLMYASRIGDLPLVTDLLRRVKESVSTPDELMKYVQHVSGEGETALHISIRAARNMQMTCGEEIALLIVDTCVRILEESPNGRNMASVLSTGDSEGDSLIHLAIKAKLWRLVDVLLRHMAITSDAGTREHLLHQAIRSGATSGVVATIVQQQQKAFLGGEVVKTALSLAVDARREDIVEVLLENGDLVTATEVFGEDSLLNRAIRSGMAESARQIWSRFSDANSANEESCAQGAPFPPVELAIRNQMYRLSFEMLARTSSCSVDNSQPRLGDALALAIRAGQLELVSALLDVMKGELPCEQLLKALIAFSASLKSAQEAEEAVLAFTTRAIEEMAADMLARAEIIDLESNFPVILQSAAGLRGELCRRLLLLLLAYLRVRSASSIFNLVTHGNSSTGASALFITMMNGEFSSALQLLHEALRKSTDEAVESQDEDESLQWMESSDTTLLHLACQYPSSQEALMIVDMLLCNGGYAGSWDSHGVSPLHVAIRHKCDARMVQLFTKHEQDLNIWSEATATVISEALDGGEAAVPLTPLMAAVDCNNVVAFRELVRCGADTRAKTPKIRLGLLPFAACRDGVATREMIKELLAAQISSSHEVSAAMSSAAAVVVLRERLARLEEALPVVDAAEEWQPVVADDNRVLRITLLGLQTPSPPVDPLDQIDAVPVPTTHPLSPARSALSPPRSPLRRSFLESEAYRKSSRPVSERQSREPSPVRQKQLDDDSLLFLHDEEKATLTLVAQEARSEAQEWLKKRSGQKKLLSEARALLQNGRELGHRRTPSGTVIPGLEKEEIVTDEQLLETHKAVAAKQFIDRHVAESVKEARAAIEREKMTIFRSTGIFPGDTFAPHPGRPKDSSIGSSSSSSALKVHRTASMNSSMLLLLSGSESDTFLSDMSSGRGIAYRKASVAEDEVQNPLELESFVHIATTRKSLS